MNGNKKEYQALRELVYKAEAKDSADREAKKQGYYDQTRRRALEYAMEQSRTWEEVVENLLDQIENRRRVAVDSRKPGR